MSNFHRLNYIFVNDKNVFDNKDCVFFVLYNYYELLTYSVSQNNGEADNHPPPPPSKVKGHILPAFHPLPLSSFANNTQCSIVLFKGKSQLYGLIVLKS